MLLVPDVREEAFSDPDGPAPARLRAPDPVVAHTTLARGIHQRDCPSCNHVPHTNSHFEHVGDDAMSVELYEAEHRIFREAFQAFLEKEVVPWYPQWEDEGIVPRDLWREAGKHGFLAMSVPEEYGGPEVDDFRYNAIIAEEIARAQVPSIGFGLHTDVVLPYLLTLATEQQKRRFLPGMVTGEIVTAIAMSEPATGSDLANVRTTAEPRDDHYLLNGSKTFITNGIHADLVLVVAKTDPSAGNRGVSLLLVERDMPGFERGRKLRKVGLHAQDTAELFFHDVVVPHDNLLGSEGRGFRYLMTNLPQERLGIAILALAGAETVWEQTLEYCKQRKAFGQPIGSFQHNRFALAEMKTELEIGRVFLDKCLEWHVGKQLSAELAAMAKWWLTELQKRVVDRCLQLHGGYGYMLEYPVARAYLDARVQSIYGGTTEIMKEIVGRSLGL